MDKLTLPAELSEKGIVILYTEDPKPEVRSHGYLLDALEAVTGRRYCEEDILREPNRKPVLRDGSVHFSVTHSGGIWMVCVSPVPVGLDLQIHKTKYSPGVAGRYFHPDEAALLEAAKESGRDTALFFAIWSAKESYAKFTGDGVAGMDKGYSSAASPVPLYRLDFREGYTLTLCTEI